MTGALLEVSGLSRRFAAPGGGELRVVEDVSFSVARGEVVALVGESGSGKSTIARLILRLMPASAGDIRLDGQDVLKGAPTLSYRRRVQMVFQDPFGSLNPAHSVGHHIERPLRIHGKPNVEARILEILSAVGLDPARSFARMWPHELSGGQRQRVAVARALAVEPDLLVADEPTSMLDVSLRAGVLDLFTRYKAERGLACLLITHDLGSARAVADRILVLYAGMLVESAPAERVVSSPAHPYTQLLLAAARPGGLRSASPAPTPAQPDAGPASIGCPFAPRCPMRMDRCGRELPPIRTIGRGHAVRCFAFPG